MTELLNESIMVDGDIGLTFPQRTWRDAFHDKAVSIDWDIKVNTLGYRIIWPLWCADIWVGRLPILKFIIGVNILVWILLWATH